MLVLVPSLESRLGEPTSPEALKEENPTMDPFLDSTLIVLAPKLEAQQARDHSQGVPTETITHKITNRWNWTMRMNLVQCFTQAIRNKILTTFWISNTASVVRYLDPTWELVEVVIITKGPQREKYKNIKTSSNRHSTKANTCKQIVNLSWRKLEIFRYTL